MRVPSFDAIPDLLGDVVRRIERQRRSAPAARVAARRDRSEDPRRRRERREGDGRSPASCQPAATPTMVPMPGSAISAERRAVERESLQPTARVAQDATQQPAVGDGGDPRSCRRLGDDDDWLGDVGVVEIEAHDAAERRSASVRKYSWPSRAVDEVPAVGEAGHERCARGDVIRLRPDARAFSSTTCTSALSLAPRRLVMTR